MLCAAVGTYLILDTRAASYSVPKEVETATISGAAASMSDSQASGSSAVRFGYSASATTNFPKTPVTSATNLIRSGEFSYFPGTTEDANGLNFGYRDFRIVQQDASGGQPNPGVNNYGTHLEIPGSFGVNATISNITGSFSLQFYASPPRIGDEFRVETKSIRATFNNGALTLRRWDGSGTSNMSAQNPVSTQNGTYTNASTLNIAVANTGGQFSVTVNGTKTSFGDGATFGSKEVWFGGNVETAGGKFTVSSLTADGLGTGTVMAVDTSRAAPLIPKSQGLQTLATKKRSDFLIGGAVAPWAMSSNINFHNRMFGGDFGIVTPENAGKFQFTHPQPGVYDFKELDAVVAEARKNNMKVHGHVLTFDEANPSWLNNMPTSTAAQKAAVQKVLTDYATAIGTRYKDTILQWDVNEIFSDDANVNNMNAAIKDSIWYRAMGLNYPAIAAKALKAANPNAKVYVNEYALEQWGSERWQAVLSAINTWKSQGAVIEGIGFQSHIYDTSGDLIIGMDNGAQFERNLKTLAARGMTGRISELDSPTASSAYPSGQSQSKEFTGMTNICLRNANCHTVSFWSIGPTNMWQDDSRRLYNGDDSMFGPDMSPRPSYTAMQNILR